MAGGLNLYGYVANNPIENIDPLGLDSTDAMLGIGGGTMGFAPAEANGIATVVVASPMASANQAIGQANDIIKLSNSPVVRATYGLFDTVTGPINVVAGGVVAGGGMTATFTLPLLGQIAGPSAAALGWLEIGIGIYKMGNGPKALSRVYKVRGTIISCYPILSLHHRPDIHLKIVADTAPELMPCFN